jgi:hypothetical protein
VKSLGYGSEEFRNVSKSLGHGHEEFSNLAKLIKIPWTWERGIQQWCEIPWTWAQGIQPILPKHTTLASYILIWVHGFWMRPNIEVGQKLDRG